MGNEREELMGNECEGLMGNECEELMGNEREELMGKQVTYLTFTDFSQAAISVFKLSNLLTCFCSFDFSCPILDNFVKFIFCIVLSY